MYFILQYRGFSSEEAASLRRPAIPGHDRLRLNRGVRVPSVPDRIEFKMARADRGVLGDYVLTGLPGLLISATFRQALEAAEVDNVQYIPATIEDEVTGIIHEGYFVANVIGVVDCLDPDESRLVAGSLPGKIRDIESLHLNETAIGGRRMFRLGRYEALVVVDAQVRDAMEAAGLKGVEAVPAEGYST